jgi:hypothetical protein
MLTFNHNLLSPKPLAKACGMVQKPVEDIEPCVQHPSTGHIPKGVCGTERCQLAQGFVLYMEPFA